MTDPTIPSDPQGVRPAAGQQQATARIIPRSANEVLRPEKVPLPPKRSRKARSQLVIFLNFLMTIITVVTILAVGAVYYASQGIPAPGRSRIHTNFIVRAGAG